MRLGRTSTQGHAFSCAISRLLPIEVEAFYKMIALGDSFLEGPYRRDSDVFINNNKDVFKEFY